MCSATDYKTKSIGGMCILLQTWAWERCPTLAPKRIPSQVENKPLGHRINGDCDVETNISIMMVSEFFVASWILCNVMSLCGSLTQQSLYHCCLPFVYLEVAWCAVVPLICFQVIEWHQPDRVLR
ncbi:Serine/threonine-protein phosphatase 7 long form [Glycine max]|nr:Serine/threonine-protein phosphatase 7 long form [Glycine max]